MNKLKEKLLSHLNSGDKTGARSVVLAQLDADRFRASMTVAHDKEALLEIDELFEPDLEVDTICSQDNWSSTYWTKMNVELSNNFSKEKFLHVIEVMILLRKKGDSKFIPKQDSQLAKSKNHTTGKRTKTVNNKGYIREALAVGSSIATGAAVGIGLAKGGVITSVLKGAVGGGILGAGIGFGIAYMIHSKK
jgi:hypothetical protein